MMTRTGWKPIVIVAGLLLLLTFLFIKSRSPDLILRDNTQAILQSFALHDAELTRDVLLARAALLPNYDSLAQTGRALIADLDALRRQSLAASAAPTRALLVEQVDALEAAAIDKLTSIEYFKSDNALLRNSLMYLTKPDTLAISEFNRDQTGSPDQVRLFHSLLRFLHTHETDAGHEVHEMLDRLRAPEAPDQPFQVLVTHGRFIADRLPVADAVVGRIIDSETSVHARVVQDTILNYSGRVEARAQGFRVMLYVAAVILLGYLLYQFYVLRARAAELKATNHTLNLEMTERQHAEHAMRASEERLRAITESAKEAIVTADSAGSVASWNAGAVALFGFEANEIMDTPFLRLFPESAHAVFEQVLAQWVDTGSPRLSSNSMESMGITKNGDQFPIEVSLSAWTTQEGSHITAIVRDISERRRLEDTARQQQLQLIQANKMTALGTLVSSVAHEINNPNQLVLMNARVIAEVWSDALGILDEYRERSGGFLLAGMPYEEIRQSMPLLTRDIHDGALRIERFVAELRDYARPRTRDSYAPFHLNEAVRRAARLLGHQINKRTARFRTDLADNLPALFGDALQIEQIVINLLMNALEALPESGRTVGVSTILDVERHCVILEVHDEGTGIAPEHLARLCDPFFTTKQESGGTGLGLAITASLVRAHGARLEFESAPDRGTRARVLYPLSRH